jgi:ABC-2 type transport system permease protein
MSFLALLEQDMRSFVRAKWFLAMLISMNLADLFIMAVVLSNMIPFDYFRFVAPGIAVVGLFAAAFVIGREVNWETRRGYNQYLLSLPIERWKLVLARVVAGGLRGVIYSMPLLITAMIFIGVPSPELLAAILLALFVVSMGISGLAISMAAILRSFEKFTTMRGFIYNALLFGSSVFYPLEILNTTPLAPIAQVGKLNPLSATTDLLRTYLGLTSGQPILMWADLLTFSAVFIGLGSFFYARAIQNS